MSQYIERDSDASFKGDDDPVSDDDLGALKKRKKPRKGKKAQKQKEEGKWEDAIDENDQSEGKQVKKPRRAKKEGAQKNLNMVKTSNKLIGEI